MKKCSRCKKQKDLTEFNFKDKVKGLRQYQCKDCSRLYVRSHYERNKHYYLLKAKKRNQKIRHRIRAFVWGYLDVHSCVDCGEKDPIVLEFDHIKNKKFDIAFLMRDHSLSDLKGEIKKCEVRCGNCHKRKTAKEFGWYKNRLPL